VVSSVASAVTPGTQTLLLRQSFLTQRGALRTELRLAHPVVLARRRAAFGAVRLLSPSRRGQSFVFFRRLGLQDSERTQARLILSPWRRFYRPAPSSPSDSSYVGDCRQPLSGVLQGLPQRSGNQPPPARTLRHGSRVTVNREPARMSASIISSHGRC